MLAGQPTAAVTSIANDTRGCRASKPETDRLRHYIVCLETPEWREVHTRNMIAKPSLRDDGTILESSHCTHEGRIEPTRLAANGDMDRTKTSSPSSLLLLSTYARSAEKTIETRQDTA